MFAIFAIFVLLTHALYALIDDIVISTRTFDIVSTARSSATSLSMAKALIVQNKGGGHGELGKLLIYNCKVELHSFPSTTSRGSQFFVVVVISGLSVWVLSFVCNLWVKTNKRLSTRKKVDGQ